MKYRTTCYCNRYCTARVYRTVLPSTIPGISENSGTILLLWIIDYGAIGVQGPLEREGLAMLLYYDSS